MIEPLESRIAPATFTVTNTNANGAGSLAAAIIAANADTVADVINFNIVGTGPFVIQPPVGLPTISQPVTIDGYSQTGSVVNTIAQGTNAVLQIVIDGSNAANDEDGFSVSGGNVVIKGLVVHGFDGAAIGTFAGSAGFVVQGCFLGTSADGMSAVPNERGISAMDPGPITVGGATLAARNLISGNRNDGINSFTDNGIYQGNLIGTDRTGLNPLGNGDCGIVFQTGAMNNTVGGESNTQRNVIAFNLTGVRVVGTSSGNAISGNSIFGSTGLGINLSTDNSGNLVTENDAGDGDTGPNGQQNFPVISSVTQNGLQFDVGLAFSAAPNRTLRLNFFLNDEVNASGHGEGKIFLGALSIGTGALGTVQTTASLFGVITPGQSISATARDIATNDTSEFGPSFSVNGVTIVDDHTATYTESDGDLVTVKVTKGTLTKELFSSAPGVVTGGVRMQRLELTDSQFDGANVTISAARQELSPGAGLSGNGLAEFGFIDSAGIDLGKVTVKGDLGRISAGDDTAADGSVKQVNVRTFGASLPASLPAGSSLESILLGSVTTIKIAGDLRGGFLHVKALNGAPEETALANLGLLQVGGSVVGGNADGSGRVFVEGSLTKGVIAGSVVGGAGDSSGFISSAGKTTSLTIGGSIRGDAGFGAGRVGLGTVGSIVVKGSVIGGQLFGAGVLSIGTSANSVLVGGSIFGGDSAGTGQVTAGAIKLLQVRGDLVGDTSGLLSDTGVIRAGEKLDDVRIFGSILGGAGPSPTSMNGGISAGDSIGKIMIAGSIVGHEGSPVWITAEGQKVKPTSGIDVAIGSVLVKGSVTNARIHAGFAGNQVSNADASIGSITVLKDWRASDIVAGAVDAGAAGFGVGDTLSPLGDTALTAQIAFIKIKGQILGTGGTGGVFGFVAQEIKKLQAGAFKIPLTLGAGNDPSSAIASGEYFIEEVS